MSEQKRCVAEALSENGWAPKWVPLGPTPYAAPVGVAGHNERYFVAPNCIDPSRGYLLIDHAREVMCIAPTLPTVRRAAKLLAKYGTPAEDVGPSIDAMLLIPDEEA